MILVDLVHLVDLLARAEPFPAVHQAAQKVIRHRFVDVSVAHQATERSDGKVAAIEQAQLALLERGDLEARVHAEDRAALAGAITAALSQATPFELTVRALWPCGTTQYIALRGRCTLADDHEQPSPRKRPPPNELVLVASNVTAEHRALLDAQAATQRERELHHIGIDPVEVDRYRAEVVDRVGIVEGFQRSGAVSDRVQAP